MNHRSLTLIVAFCVLSTSALAGPRPKPMKPATPDPGDQAIRLIDKSISKLANLERMLVRARKLNRKDVSSLKLEIQAVHSDLLTIKGELINLRGACIPGPRHPTVVKKPLVPTAVKPVEKKKMRPKGPPPMKPDAFKALLSSMDQQSFASDKLTVVKEAARSNGFTVAQVKQLLDRLTHSADKLDLLKVVNKRIVDRKNLFQVYSSFTFSNDKDAAKKILEGGK